MIRAVVADDHAIIRRGLRALLESESACQVVGEAADGLTTAALITELTPDVATVDLQMPDLDGLEMLTDREREVLQPAAQGMTNTEIGVRLAISPRTAETHRINLMRKLNLSTQTDLVFFALGRGLLPERR